MTDKQQKTTPRPKQVKNTQTRWVNNKKPPKIVQKERQLARRRAADLKRERLELHGLISDIGRLAEQGKKTAGEFDQALKFAKAFDQLKDCLAYKGSKSSDFTDNLISRFEDLMALIVALLNTKNYAGFIGIVHLYVRTHYKESVSKFIIDKIKEIFEEGKTFCQGKLHQQSTETDLDGNSLEETPEQKLQAFKNCISNWKQYRTCAFAKQLCQLVNILTTFGWTDLDENPIKLGTLELFRARAWNIQQNSLDFLDVIVDTFGFFVERGYLAFAHGDLSLLLYNDAESARFETEYSLLMACDTLLETGRLEDLKTEEVQGESDFEHRLERLIMQNTTMIQLEKNPHAKTVLTNRLVSLKRLRSKLILLQKQSPVRMKPYGVSTFGGSSIAKSTINAIITKVLLHANGFKSGKDSIVTLNDSDPYQSEFRTFHTAVTLDDFGNTKADKYDGSPTAKIVDFLNNVPKAALSPIAELKGNVMMRPKLVTVTTNVKTLLANLFSNEPVSILRRFEVHLDVKLREEWVDPSTGGVNTSMFGTEFIPDAWLIKLQRVKIIRTASGADDFTFETILDNASLRECLDWMIVDTKRFYAEQDAFVNKTEKFYDMHLCEHSDDPSQCTLCAAKKVCEIIDEDVPLLESYESDDEDSDSEDEYEPILESHAHEYDIDEGECDAETEIFDPVEYVPLQSTVEQWYRKIGADKFTHYIKTECKNLAEAFEKHKEETLKVTLAAAGSIALVYGALKLFNSFRKVSDTLNGHAREDGIPILTDLDHESNWKKPEIAAIPKSTAGSTTSSEEFEAKIRKHLAYCTIEDKQTMKARSCNIFPICGNVWLLPSHMIDENHVVHVHVKQGRGDSVNRTFTEIVDESSMMRFGDDYLLIRLVNGGPVPDMLKYIVQEDFKFQPEHIKFSAKDEDGTMSTYVSKTTERKQFTTVKGVLEGMSYNLPVPTGPGMCIAPIYTYRSPHTIIGFHLAGRTGERMGVAGVINVAQIREALSALELKDSLQCHSEATMPTEKYCKNFDLAGNIPMDHAVHKLETIDGQDPSAEIYGAHGLGRSFFKSQVRTSPISQTVKEVMKIERVHGPPKRGDVGKHWLRDISAMTHPKGLFMPKSWRSARSDYLRKVDRFLESHPQAANITYPLAHDYVMAGADGIAAFSRIPLNTSMGWPLNKAKNKFIGPVDRKVPGITEAIDFEDPIFREEIDRMRSVLARGERVHTVFRGSLKDEPTKWTKDKIRVFAGCEIAFTCLTRQYYLPIVRLMQNSWLEFEIAVGINAHGPQWAELTEYVKQHGAHRIIAGDYAAFDKTASPKAMMAAFDILIHIARRCGYSEEDLKIMRGIATEISYPIYEMDGVILQLFGSNPSGHPLTVIVNNLMNSLYMRYVYYELHKDNPEVPDFDTVIALLCYGDDNIMSVSEKEKLFKMSKIVPILEACGIKYTKADKTAVTEEDDFENLDEVEFLKRGFLWNKAFGTWTAPLEVNSIGKSLHNQMVSKTTPRDVIAADAIKSANAEFAFHGPEVFHERHEQLKTVAKECGLTELVGELPTLDILVDRFHQSKTPRAMEDEPILDVQCSEEDLSSTSSVIDSFATESLAILDVFVQEAEHIVSGEERLQQSVIDLMGKKPYLQEAPVFSRAIGSVDLIFSIGLGLQPVNVLVETKCVINKTNRRQRNKKVFEQAEKYGTILSLCSSTPVVALTYTELGFTHVKSFNMTHRMKCDMQDWMIDTLLFNPYPDL